MFENMASLGATSLKQESIFKGLIVPILGLMSSYLVNTQLNSKFYPPPPPKFSGSTPDCRIKDFFGTSLKFAGCAPGDAVNFMINANI